MGNTAKQRHRSPEHPYLTLPDALEKITTIYERDRRHFVPVDVIAKHFGYENLKSSSALRLVAALAHYGLVEESGRGDDRKMKLSARALDIVLAESEGSPERVSAIREAATLPAVHRRILDEYPDGLPSDAVLRSFLLRTLNFNDAHVDLFIKKLRTTFGFAGIERADTIKRPDEQEQPDDVFDGDIFSRALPKQKMNPPAARTPTGQQFGEGPKADFRPLPVVLPSLRVAVLNLPVPMTEADYKAVTDALATWKPALTKPSNDEADGDDDDRDE